MSKIVVGLAGTASAEDASILIEEGASEFYIGYIPSLWSDRFGFATSPNRRSWRGASFTERASLQRVVTAAKKGGASVSLTLNELQYTTTTRPIVHQIFEESLQIGIDNVIVSEPTVCMELHELHPDVPIIASGDFGVYNCSAVSCLADWGIRRVILPRYLTGGEIRALCGAANARTLDTEAFVMSERCTFEGAFCFPSHGYLERHLCNELHNPTVFNRVNICVDSRDLSEHERQHRAWQSHVFADKPDETGWIGGECGLCAIRFLVNAGVHYLKIVGRGVDCSVLVRRIQAARRVLCYSGADFESYCREVLGVPEFCASGYRCYYRDLQC